MSASSTVVDLHASDVEKATTHGFKGHGSPSDPYIVKFLPGDAENPMGWSGWRRWGITANVSIVTLCVGFGSSIFAGGIPPMMVYFNGSRELLTAGISLYVLGFATGPLAWAPLSEVFGRRPIFIVSYLPFVLFTFATGGSKNITTLLVCRFFAGLFGSSALTNSGGTVSDLFTAKERSLALSLFALAPFLGPVLGPAIAGFITEYSNWRVLFWVNGAFAAVMFCFGSLVPETYTPVLLRRKAALLSATTGESYMSEYDLYPGAQASLGTKLRINMTRPFILLFKEPIVLLFSIYAAIIYGMLYSTFGAFPYVFQFERGWTPGIGGLAFIGIGLGMILGVIVAVFENKRYGRLADANGGSLPPEARLPLTCFGACLLPISLFWMAWTVEPSVHWIVPIIGSVPFGTGMLLVFLSMINYLVDSYLMYAASVLAANAVLRSLFGAAFPLFTIQMFQKLGSSWALSVFAFISLPCTLIPFMFIQYGARIRAISTFAPGHKTSPVKTETQREIAEEVREEDMREEEVDGRQ